MSSHAEDAPPVFPHHDDLSAQEVAVVRRWLEEIAPRLGGVSRAFLGPRASVRPGEVALGAPEPEGMLWAFSHPVLAGWGGLLAPATSVAAVARLALRAREALPEHPPSATEVAVFAEWARDLAAALLGAVAGSRLDLSRELEWRAEAQGGPGSVPDRRAQLWWSVQAGTVEAPVCVLLATRSLRQAPPLAMPPEARRTIPPKALLAAQLPVEAIGGRTTLSLRDLLGLRVGSIVLLDRPEVQQAELRVGRRTISRGTAGVVGGKLAIRAETGPAATEETHHEPGLD